MLNNFQYSDSYEKQTGYYEKQKTTSNKCTPYFENLIPNKIYRIANT